MATGIFKAVRMVIGFSILPLYCFGWLMAADLDSGRYFDDLGKISSFTPRNEGTPGEQNTGQWLAGRLEAAGYTIVTQFYPIKAYSVESCQLKIEGFGKKIRTAVWSYAVGVVGRYEITDNAQDCEGKILLLSMEKIRRMDASIRQKPPEMIFSYSGDESPLSGSCGNYHGTYYPETGELDVHLPPVVALGNKDGERIARLLKNRKVYAHIELKSQIVNSRSRNIIAVGKDFDRSGKYLCLCANYDTLPGSGADAHGSGTALLLALADYFSQRQGNIIFALFGSQNMGSWWFVDRFIGTNHPPYCAVSIDSVLDGIPAFGYSGFPGYSEYPDFPEMSGSLKSVMDILESTFLRLGMKYDRYRDPVRYPISNDFLFNLRTIPAVFVSGSRRKYYVTTESAPKNDRYRNAENLKKALICFITNTITR